MNAIEIGDRRIGPGEPTFVIAEAGSNHNGDLDTAKELIDVAARAGADAVKFQTFRADTLYTTDSGGVEYLDDDRPIHEIIESMEMPYEWIPELAEHCDRENVMFLSTPFDERSADELAPYVPAFKIASYTMSHHPFLRYLAEMDRPIIMSTGAHELTEIRESVDVLRDAGTAEFVLLQCIAAYPTPLEAIDVRVIERLHEEFDVLAGLSDHTLDPIAAPSAAVSLGASVIEKHITLDRSMAGPDHRFALEPDALERMIETIRSVETALGTGKKRIRDVERELHDVARRSIHATTDIEAGAELTTENVAVLRPGHRENGLAPKFFETILGRQATRPIERDEGVTWVNVSGEPPTADSNGN